MTLWERGIRRGEAMRAFYESEIESLEGKRVLDLGCGTGGISIAYAQRAAFLASYDLRRARISLVKERMRERNIGNVGLAVANGLSIPFKDRTFDLVIMNGVLEWLGLKGNGSSPKRLQEQGLRECVRVLKERGTLYLAVENRWYPKYALRDPHAGIPAVDFLPRPLASILSRAFGKGAYRNYIYSHRALDTMLRQAGFGRTEFYVPLFHYQFPLAILGMADKKGMLEALTAVDRNRCHDRYHMEAMGKTGKARVIYYRVISSLGLLKSLASSFVVICTKM